MLRAQKGDETMEMNTKESYINQVINEMKNLGTYKKEFNHLIDIYSGMLLQYRIFEKEFQESGFKITEEHTNKAGATNQRKVPVLTAMESLRKDIASYSDRLCLNPKSLNVEPPKTEVNNVSPLDSFLARVK